MEFQDEQSNEVLEYFTILKTDESNHTNISLNIEDNEEKTDQSRLLTFTTENEDELSIEVLPNEPVDPLMITSQDDNIGNNQQVILESDLRLYQLEDGRLFVGVETPDKLQSTFTTNVVHESEISNFLSEESKNHSQHKKKSLSTVFVNRELKLPKRTEEPSINTVNLILLSEEEKSSLPRSEDTHYLLEEDTVDLAKTQNEFKCLYSDCYESFPTFFASTVHMKTHAIDIKPYACTLEGCDKRFSTNYSRKTHIRTHTGEKPYACKDCSKAFKTSGDLHKHSRLHTGEKPFQCPLPGCGKYFRTSNIRKVHVRSHTGERPYVCDYPNCGKAFSSSTNFKNHSRIHSGERPFVCFVPGCNKRFTEYSSLYKHSAVHQVDRPFECSFCQQNFKSESALNLHKRVRHNVILSPDGVEIVVSIE